MTPKRAAILKASQRLGVTLPEDLIDDLEAFEPSAVGPEWSFLLPPAWKSLEVAVQEDFGQAWDGASGFVVGENSVGDLVCLMPGPDGEIVPDAHLLRHDTMELERMADDLAALVDGVDDGLSEEDLPPMSEEESAGLAAALGRLLGGDAPAPEPEPMNPALAASIGKALDALILAELLELEPGRRQALIEELCASTGEARTPKALVRKFVRTLVESDHPEEVYGTDTELESAVRNAWS